MKVQTRDGTRGREIATAMAVSTPALARIAAKWDRKKGLFKDPWSNAFGGLCVGYYDKYGKAPGKAVQSLVEHWAQEQTDQATVELVESFAESLSGQYVKKGKEVNPQYVVDRAEEYFTRVKLERLRDQLDAELDAGRVQKAQAVVDKFDPVKLTGSKGVDVLRDKDALKAAFSNRAEPLVKLKGAIGNFIGAAVCRGGFVALESPEKRGKTTFQQEICWQAVLQRRKVSLFEVGDETEEDMVLRFAVRAAMRPYGPTEKDEPVRYPTYIEPSLGKEGTPQVTWDERHFRKFLNFHMARRALKRVVGKIGSKECLLKLYTYPNFTVSMRDVLAVVRDEERQGRVADIVDVDYMDILAPPSSSAEVQSRDQINMNWMLARQLSQQYHCCFLTASQTKASSYDADTLDMSHFSEDKRKRGHSTITIGINQTDDEKKAGVFRLNVLARRKGKFDRKKFLYCASCMEIGNPFVLTTY